MYNSEAAFLLVLKDCFVLKKGEGPKKRVLKHSEHDHPWTTAGSAAANSWEPSYFPSCQGVPYNTGHPAGNQQQQSLLTLPHENKCAETSGYLGHNTSLTPSVHPGAGTPGPSSMQPRAARIDNGVDRFMPRTTHLQERKRKREEGASFALLGTSVDKTEVVFGPQLPGAPKVDMDDESLNTSVALIRNKMKEVLALQAPAAVIAKHSWCRGSAFMANFNRSYWMKVEHLPLKAGVLTA